MKLAFYSGGDEDENLQMDIEVLKLHSSSQPQITFIPSSSYMAGHEFNFFVSHYSRFGINKFIHFPVDIPYSDLLLSEVLKSDIIHLGGGNTFYFLKSLRKKKLIHLLKNFVRGGGVLTGLSAGAIIMTPYIYTASFPDFDRDENEEMIKNLKGLSLVNFDFFPHYKNSQRYEREMIKYSLSSRRPLYACPDGAGIIVNGEKVKFIGRVFCFYRGERFKVHQV